MIRTDNLQYITGKKLNKSDDKIIAEFETYNPQVIDEKSGIRGIKIEKPNSTNYLYFSEKLQKEQLESRARKIYPCLRVWFFNLYWEEYRATQNIAYCCTNILHHTTKNPLSLLTDLIDENALMGPILDFRYIFIGNMDISSNLISMSWIIKIKYFNRSDF
jgi:hypothetical protein